jgi:hypothetical protein
MVVFICRFRGPQMWRSSTSSATPVSFRSRF